MAKYVSLLRFTAKGLGAVKESPDRSDKVRALGDKVGAQVQDIFWTIGQYDVVMVYEAPDDETATAFMLGVARRGNVTTETLRAFDAGEFKAIVGRLEE